MQTEIQKLADALNKISNLEAQVAELKTQLSQALKIEEVLEERIDLAESVLLSAANTLSEAGFTICSTGKHIDKAEQCYDKQHEIIKLVGRLNMPYTSKT